VFVLSSEKEEKKKKSLLAIDEEEFPSKARSCPEKTLYRRDSANTK
jgi:hypothetical protein